MAHPGMKRGKHPTIDRWKFRKLWESGASTEVIMAECGIKNSHSVYNIALNMKLQTRHPEFRNKRYGKAAIQLDNN